MNHGARWTGAFLTWVKTPLIPLRVVLDTFRPLVRNKQQGMRGSSSELIAVMLCLLLRLRGFRLTRSSLSKWPWTLQAQYSSTRSVFCFSL